MNLTSIINTEYSNSQHFKYVLYKRTANYVNKIKKKSKKNRGLFIVTRQKLFFFIKLRYN